MKEFSVSLEHWLLFLAVWVAASLPLGPNALNCIALSAGTGFRRSLWALCGILLASVCHMTATLFGVATVLATNATLFQTVKIVGAAYLIWMGISLWRRGGRIEFARSTDSPARIAIVRRAFLVSMSNPKAVFAYLAVFSQFVEPGSDLSARLAVLVPTSFAVTILVYGGYCALGLGIARALGTAPRWRLFNRAVGALYMAIGGGLAFSDGPSGRAS
jgi:threonine/homoserine/homoserine lactone efflux protein